MGPRALSQLVARARRSVPMASSIAESAPYVSRSALSLTKSWMMLR